MNETAEERAIKKAGLEVTVNQTSVDLPRGTIQDYSNGMGETLSLPLEVYSKMFLGAVGGMKAVEKWEKDMSSVLTAPKTTMHKRGQRHGEYVLVAGLIAILGILGYSGFKAMNHKPANKPAVEYSSHQVELPNKYKNNDN